MREKSKIHINQEEIAEYLKDIRKLPVMTPEREKELAEKMLSGTITEMEKKQIQQEKTINAALVKEIAFIVQKSDSINNRFSRHYNQAKFWCDSIAAASK